ncbi:MAG: DNA gyrase subunit A, partial [Bacteroidia bacterium]
LPDVRDGLKPVHRRVLYSMSELGLSYNRPYKKSARIVGECFVKGTLVSTPNGLIPIEKLEKGDTVYTHKGIQKVTELYEMPQQPLLTIKGENGVKTTCTKGQMFKIFNENLQYEWKKAEDLKDGDYLVGKFNAYPVLEYTHFEGNTHPSSSEILNYQIQSEPLLLQEMGENEISLVKVTLIENADADITYDIQVENDHEFIANGLLVHNCLGKYHPHGDTAVYDTMVRMAQPWSLRYPMVDGQGNFGSVDGDNPAAMRYTEARLRRIAEQMLADLEKNTVDFRPNFDDSLTEPTVLPAIIPNLLVNGSSGIAVGMATNMAPHNLNEVADAIAAYIDNRGITIEELCKYVKGPDFPTGATIVGLSGIQEAYYTGRGRVVIRSKAEIITTEKGDREQIIITEIPYQVNKAETVKKIDRLINEKKIEGIADINDESDRDGMRIVVDIKREASANVVLNQLYQLTPLQNSFSINNVALVKGRPMTLNLKDMIRHYVDHRHEVIVRRTQYDLDEARKKAHILEGLLVAIDNLDEAIRLIRSSRTPDEALSLLTERTWKADTILSILVFGEGEEKPETYQLSDVQAKAILEMRLQRLTGLERDKILDQYREIMAKIDYYLSVLSSEELIMSIIKKELEDVRLAFGDKRRTEITHADGEISYEDLIENEDVIVTISHSGYVKRTSSDEYRVQGRGGTGFKGAGTKNDDFVEYIFGAKTHNYLLVFTEKGRCYWLKVYEIPKGDRTNKGRAIQNLIQIEPDDKIKAFITVESLDNKEFVQSHSVIMVTKRGTVKKTSLEAYSRPRANGINAINIVEGDELVEAKLTDGNSEIILAIRSGRAIRFHEEEAREMGRNSTGVRGIRLDSAVDEVVGMVTIQDPTTVNLLVVSEKGYGKRTALQDAETGEDIYRITSRGGKGVRTLNVTEKTGQLVAIRMVDDSQDIMIITKNGITIRMSATAISVIGRAAQGVRLIKLREGDEIASVTNVAKEEEAEEVDVVVATDEGNTENQANTIETSEE